MSRLSELFRQTTKHSDGNIIMWIQLEYKLSEKFIIKSVITPFIFLAEIKYEFFLLLVYKIKPKICEEFLYTALENNHL